MNNTVSSHLPQWFQPHTSPPLAAARKHLMSHWKEVKVQDLHLQWTMHAKDLLCPSQENVCHKQKDCESPIMISFYPSSLDIREWWCLWVIHRRPNDLVASHTEQNLDYVSHNELGQPNWHPPNRLLLTPPFLHPLPIDKHTMQLQRLHTVCLLQARKGH